MPNADLNILPDWNAPTTPFRHTWEGFLNVDQFRWMVRADMLEQLAMAARELGGRHVRAVGMLDDEMRVLTPDPEHWPTPPVGLPAPNWQVVTYVIERLLSIGLHPMFTTSFMPSALAAGTRGTFTVPSNISQPSDLRAWQRLISDGVKHCISHFGLDIVRQWHFEVWNEPNLTGFFDGNQQDFFQLYRTTHQAIKEVDASLRIGGPSTARAEWLPEMIEFGHANDCLPDYLITHIYNNDSDAGALSPFDGPQSDKIAKSPNFASGVIRGTRKLLGELGYGGEVHWNEWGRSWFPADAIRESSNEAAWIVKTMAEVSQQADVFSYWNLSDIYDQVGYGRSAFHGNYGMLNLQGLRKPSYNAFRLLHALGTERIPLVSDARDEVRGAIATRSSEGRYQLLVYAFEGGEDLESSSLQISIKLPENGQVSSLTAVTPTENNIVQVWRDHGSPRFLKAELLKELRELNGLTSTKNPSSTDGTFRFQVMSPCIALVEMEAN